MKQQYRALCLTLGVFLLASACSVPVPPTDPPAVERTAVTTIITSSRSESVEDLEAEESMAEPVPPEQAMDLLSGVDWPMEGVLQVSSIEGTTFQVSLTDETVQEMWDILTADLVVLEDGADDRVFLGEYDAVSLSFTSDETRYLIRLYGCNETHSEYPSQTVVDVEQDGAGVSDLATYIGPYSVFAEIRDRITQLKGNLKVLINQPVIELETEELTGAELTAWMQLTDRIVCGFSKQGDTSYLMTFDSKTGHRLGTSRVSEPIRRIEASREMSGFDYRVFTDTRILYKNSRDPLVEKAYVLPVSVKDWAKGNGNFDVKNETLLWVDDEGVWKAKEDGSEAQLWIPNTELDTYFVKVNRFTELSSNVRPVCPRIMNEGQQAVIPLAVNDMLVGLLRLDFTQPFDPDRVENGMFDIFDGTAEPLLDYPDKRTVAAAGSEDITLINVSDGEMKRLPFARDGFTEWYTGDYSNFVVRETGQDDLLFLSYLVSARKPEDRSREFLMVQGRGDFRVIGASERNLLVYISDDDGSRYGLINYRL